MPQLDASAWAPQLIWLAICFIGLYFIMARYALPRIGGVLEQRRDKIADDLDQAERLKKDTEQAIAAYEAALAEARTNAHAIAEKTRSALKEETDRQRAALEAELAEKTEQAARRIAAAKNAAMAQVREVAADTAGVIVAELIGAKVTKEKILGALGKAAHG